MGVLGWAVLGQTPLGAVGAPSGTGMVTLAEAKAHLNLTTTRYDAEMQVLLDEALDILEAETGRPFEVRAITDTDTEPAAGCRLVLSSVPCPCRTCRPHVMMTVSSVVVDGVPVDVVDWRLDGPVVSWRAVGRGAVSYATEGVTVTYTAGYATTPPWLRLAVLRLVEHLWQKTQQAPHPALGQVGGGYDESQPSGLSYLLPYQVASLIDRHRVLV